jgi:dihydrodipicolinate synthase/N-acetylneuraminate lyase
MNQQANKHIDPSSLIRTQRAITGMSAVFLPFKQDRVIDWEGFNSHLERTIASGLIPAVNMDTGSIQHIGTDDRVKVLDITSGHCRHFVAGACVVDHQGDSLNLSAYRKAMDEVILRGGIPVVFPSWGLNSLANNHWLAAVEQITAAAEKFIAFELGEQFVPYGRILDTETWSNLLDLPNCIGAKHSSLDRSLEWQRLIIRNAKRPDFMVLTGNDLAIDMVIYGSDYLLGLSSFAPELFAQRDKLWLDGDPGFYGLNDSLQYLGQFVFRDPVPSYKHSAAQFLHICGTLSHEHPPPGVEPRADSDRPVLEDIAGRLGLLP